MGGLPTSLSLHPSRLIAIRSAYSSVAMVAAVTAC